MMELHARVGPDDAGMRLDRFLGQAVKTLSRGRVRSLIEQGAVYETRGDMQVEQTNPRSVTRSGAVYKVVLPEPVSQTPLAEPVSLDILFEDRHFILVNKPAGMAVHPAPGSRSGTLVNALLHNFADGLSTIGGIDRPGIVHRIDKDTTGVLAIARTDPAHQALGLLFSRHDIDRTYLALTHGAPRPMAGIVTTGIGRSRHDRRKMAVMPLDGARRALTRYRVVATYGQKTRRDTRPAACLVACRLETGRTHQIRLHMAHLGTPLIGDRVYGHRHGIKVWGTDSANIQVLQQFNRQALHAHSLGFVHPFTGKRVFAKAPVPQDMAELVTALASLQDVRNAV